MPDAKVMYVQATTQSECIVSTLVASFTSLCGNRVLFKDGLPTPMKGPQKPVDCCVAPPTSSTITPAKQSAGSAIVSPYEELNSVLPAASQPPVDCCDPFYLPAVASDCPYETPMKVCRRG
jgi:hypothetical protein